MNLGPNGWPVGMSAEEQREICEAVAEALQASGGTASAAEVRNAIHPFTLARFLLPEDRAVIIERACRVVADPVYRIASHRRGDWVAVDHYGHLIDRCEAVRSGTKAWGERKLACIAHLESMPQHLRMFALNIYGWPGMRRVEPGVSHATFRHRRTG